MPPQSQDAEKGQRDVQPLGTKDQQSPNLELPLPTLANQVSDAANRLDLLKDFLQGDYDGVKGIVTELHKIHSRLLVIEEKSKIETTSFPLISGDIALVSQSLQRTLKVFFDLFIAMDEEPDSEKERLWGVFNIVLADGEGTPSLLERMRWYEGFLVGLIEVLEGERSVGDIQAIREGVWMVWEGQEDHWEYEREDRTGEGRRDGRRQWL